MVDGGAGIRRALEKFSVGSCRIAMCYAHVLRAFESQLRLLPAGTPNARQALLDDLEMLASFGPNEFPRAKDAIVSKWQERKWQRMATYLEDV